MARRLSASLLLALAACGGSEAADLGYEVVDSAGIVLVRNPAEAAWTHIPRPTVTEDLRIGTIDGGVETQFGQIIALDVGSDGSIYVLDRQSSNVRVFDATGSHVRTMGRAGEGPGELEGGMGLMVTPGDTAWAVDGFPFSTRLVAFGPDGAAAGTLPLTRDIRNAPFRWEPAPGGIFLAQVRTAADEDPDLIVAYDPRTGSADTLWHLDPVGGPSADHIYAPGAQWAVLSDGRVVAGCSDEHGFSILRGDGSLERIVTRDALPRLVSESVREALLQERRELLSSTTPSANASPEARQLLEDRVRDQLARLTISDHFPAYTDLIAGPRDTFWTKRFHSPDEVEAAGEEGPPNLWDVYDAEGRLLGSIELPRDFYPQLSRGNHLYGTVRDELEVSYVVRLRVGWDQG